MKKLALGLGTLTAVAAPVAAVIACGEPGYFTSIDIKLSSPVKLLPDNATTGDINSNDVTGIFGNLSDQELFDVVSKISDDTEDIHLEIDYKEAVVKFDIKVKSVTHIPVIDEGDISVTPKNTSFDPDQDGKNILKLKSHVKALVTNMLIVSTKSGVTVENVRTKIFGEYANDHGVNFFTAKPGEDSTAPWDGTWVTNEPFLRSAWVFTKDSDSLDMILNGSDLASAPTQLLDPIEQVLREFTKTLKGDNDFDAFAKAEEAIAPGQSQISLGTYTSKGESADDIIVLGINTLNNDLLNKFIQRAKKYVHLSTLRWDAIAVWDTISALAVAK